MNEMWKRLERAVVVLALSVLVGAFVVPLVYCVVWPTPVQTNPCTKVIIDTVDLGSVQTKEELESTIVALEIEIADVKRCLALQQDAGHVAFREIVFLQAEIAEWEAYAARRNAEPNEQPSEVVIEDTTPSFTDLVQTSIKGVVHLQAPDWQGSGFVVGPRHIVTARHCTTGVVDFLLTLNDGCQFRATRAYRNKDSDVSHIWVDDLKCVNEGINHRITCGGKHDVVLHPLLLGNIEDCVLGQSVYVIGSPFGRINRNAITTGIISGLGRDWSSLGSHYGWNATFTSDASGNPGNSGGPLFTMDGVVRGVLVGGFTSTCVNYMPCDLFMTDLETIRLMFTTDRYEREEATGYDEYWNYRDGNEYY